MGRSDTLTHPEVLIVEDDEAIGHLTAWCRSGSAALVHARAAAPAVVLLDLGLPGLDGVDVARTLRSELPDSVIIMLTARSEEIDLVIGLDAGADDYLVKPFQLTVLLARLRAHLRRRPVEADPPILELGAVTLDLASRRCRVADHDIILRAKELDLLIALGRSRG